MGRFGGVHSFGRSREAYITSDSRERRIYFRMDERVVCGSRWPRWVYVLSCVVTWSTCFVVSSLLIQFLGKVVKNHCFGIVYPLFFIGAISHYLSVEYWLAGKRVKPSRFVYMVLLCLSKKAYIMGRRE
jgi:hypothetical protein